MALTDDKTSDLAIMQDKVKYVFMDDDFSDYTEDENELNERIENLTSAISSYNASKLYFTKDSILNPYILRVLAHCIKDTDNDLDEDRLNELTDNYNEITNFINDNKDYKKILGFYGDIVKKDDNGLYEINETIIDKIASDNGFKVRTDEKEPIKDAINDTWENKAEILDPSEINSLSEKQRGINFKQFIFCEEYLKQGKIKPTCDYLGISRNTAYLWLDDKKVQDYLKQRQESIKKETDGLFFATYRSSFNALNKMINSDVLDAIDKIKAIDVFLKHYENIERLKQPSTQNNTTE